jgi:hypothetical protein
LPDHQLVGGSVVATRIEHRTVGPDLIDVARVHAYMLVQVDQLAIELEGSHLVEGSKSNRLRVTALMLGPTSDITWSSYQPCDTL